MPELSGTVAGIDPADAVAAAASAEPGHRTGAEIAGLGIALPEKVVANAEIAARFGLDEDWIVKRTGIEERRIVAPGERLFELAATAAERALAATGVGAEQIDLVIVATTSNDELMPGASPRVAAAIGASRAGAIDVNAACTGFVAALSVACGQIESGRAQQALVIGADLMSRITDPSDRSTSAVFADGAGAAVIRGAAVGRIGPIVLGADGTQADLLVTPRETGLTKMQGHEVFKHAVDRLAEATESALDAAGVDQAEIDLFVYHQANARILRAVSARLDLDPDRVFDCIGKYGNTSAASIPLALEEARLGGALPGDARVLISAVGAGLTWGATVIEWGSGS